MNEMSKSLTFQLRRVEVGSLSVLEVLEPEVQRHRDSWAVLANRIWAPSSLSSPSALGNPGSRAAPDNLVDLKGRVVPSCISLAKGQQWGQILSAFPSLTRARLVTSRSVHTSSVLVRPPNRSTLILIIATLLQVRKR
jgi:hypothetical protein